MNYTDRPRSSGGCAENTTAAMKSSSSAIGKGNLRCLEKMFHGRRLHSVHLNCLCQQGLCFVLPVHVISKWFICCRVCVHVRECVCVHVFVSVFICVSTHLQFSSSRNTKQPSDKSVRLSVPYPGATLPSISVRQATASLLRIGYSVTLTCVLLNVEKKLRRVNNTWSKPSGGESWGKNNSFHYLLSLNDADDTLNLLEEMMKRMHSEDTVISWLWCIGP